MMKKIIVIASILATCSMAGTLKDSRDGQTYKTVKIGDQTWMAENLNYKTSGSACYDSKESNCEKYGRLYTWESAKKACPAGWRLPSVAEFEGLLDIAGGEIRSLNLRARSWENGSDKFGFSALPAGFYFSSYGETFSSLGYCTDFWSSTENKNYGAYELVIYDDFASVNNSGKDRGYSVRCLQDSNEGGEASSLRSEAQPPSGTLKDSRDGQTYKTVQIGNQTWMAENLNYKTGESKCYDNKESNCKKYGRLYTWDEALNACPSGWHLPSEDEFGTLLATVGASSGDGSNLRAASWENGADKFGFSALPAGSYGSYSYGTYYGSYDKEFGYVGRNASFWSSTEGSGYGAYYLGLDDSTADVFSRGKDYGRSVRCLQD